MGYIATAEYICSLHLEFICCIHPCYIRNIIRPSPCWSNKFSSKIAPSDDGPYLTASWIVILRPDQGRPYFNMGAVITWHYLQKSVISVRGYFKVWGIFNLRSCHASCFCMPKSLMEVTQVSAFVIMYFTWWRLFPCGYRHIPNISIALSAFTWRRGILMPYLFFSVNFSKCLCLYISIYLNAISNQLNTMHFY